MTKKTASEIEKRVIELYTTRGENGWNGNKMISRILNISPTTVINILIRNNIMIRNDSESHLGKACKPITNIPPLGEKPPLCKCGCGKQVEWHRAKNGWYSYVIGHYQTHKIYQEYKYLYNEYVIKKRPSTDIANEWGVDYGVILRWLRINNIKTRKQSESLKIGGKVKGENNPAWKGGVAKWEYSFDWKSICKQIKDRDKWTCQSCGEQRQRWGIFLHVHHIDGNKLNNSQNNLVSLCAKCHSDVHAGRIHLQPCFPS